MYIRHYLLLLVIVPSLQSSLGLALACTDVQCLSSSRAMPWHRERSANSVSPQTNISLPRSRVRKLATFAQNVASRFHEHGTVIDGSRRPIAQRSHTNHAKAHHGADGTPSQRGQMRAKQRSARVEASTAAFAGLKSLSYEVAELASLLLSPSLSSSSSSPSANSSTIKVPKVPEDFLAHLLTLLGSPAPHSSKGVVVGTILAKMAKKFLESRTMQLASSSSSSPFSSASSSFARRSMLIGRRSGRSYLDAEAIILFILGLGIGSVMGLSSVLIPLGLYGGYGPAAVPINTQVAGRRRRRDIHGIRSRRGLAGAAARTPEVVATSEETLDRIGLLLMKATERYST